jgi:hypothetical protein
MGEFISTIPLALKPTPAGRAVFKLKGGRLTGRLLHAPQKSRVVDVDVAYRGIRDELAALAVILMCDDILSFHHD